MMWGCLCWAAGGANSCSKALYGSGRCSLFSLNSQLSSVLGLRENLLSWSIPQEVSSLHSSKPQPESTWAQKGNKLYLFITVLIVAFLPKLPFCRAFGYDFSWLGLSVPACSYISPRELFWGERGGRRGRWSQALFSKGLSKCMVCKGEIMSKLLEVELQLRRGFWVEKGENS